MKKIFAIIICLLLALSASACKPSNLEPNNYSSDANGEMDVSSELSSQSSRTLVRAWTGSDEVSSLKSLSIILYNNSFENKITNCEDWAFFEKYVYFDTVSESKKDELTDSGETNLIKIGISEQKYYLLKDGSIIIPEMCGDSGVMERYYEIYKAEKNYMLNEQKLYDLLKKYNDN